MSLYVTLNPLVQIAEDSSGTGKTYYPTTKSQSSAGFDNQMNSSLQIAAAGSQSLTFGDVTAVKGFYLEVNQDCLVTINGGTPIQLRRHPTATTTTKARFVIEADISSILVDNAAGVTELTGQYVAWGDPTP
jgi:hypothetical protein